MNKQKISVYQGKISIIPPADENKTTHYPQIS